MKTILESEFIRKALSPEEFKTKLLNHKAKSHTLFEGTGGYNIRRGMGHSISGYVEDLFSVFLASNIGRLDLIFFVDKVVSFRSDPNGKAKSFKPDLLIINGNTAAHYYDLKTDIGFGREMNDYLEDRNRFIQLLRGKDAWITVGNKREHDIKFTNSVKYSIVVTLGWNVDPEILQANIEYANGLDGIELYVLINHNKKSNQLRINNEDFTRLINDCNSNFL